jgi:hypothetical protein
MSGHVRLVLCLLQALEELQAHGRCRRGCLGAAGGLDLRTRSIVSSCICMCMCIARRRRVSCGSRLQCGGRQGPSGGEVVVDPVSFARSLELPVQHHHHRPPTVPHRSYKNTAAAHLTHGAPGACHGATRAARTGAFWRLAARPSLSPGVAPAALRFDALSILAGAAIASYVRARR